MKMVTTPLCTDNAKRTSQLRTLANMDLRAGASYQQKPMRSPTLYAWNSWKYTPPPAAPRRQEVQGVSELCSLHTMLRPHGVRCCSS